MRICRERKMEKKKKFCSPGIGAARSPKAANANAAPPPVTTAAIQCVLARWAAGLPCFEAPQGVGKSRGVEKPVQDTQPWESLPGYSVAEGPCPTKTGDQMGESDALGQAPRHTKLEELL